MDCNNSDNNSSINCFVNFCGLELVEMTARRMKNSFVLIIVLLVVASCSPEPAEFREITNARIVSSTGDLAKVKADALFYNPNKRSGKVQRIDLVVTFKDEEMAHINEDSQVKVGGMEEFIIPLDINLDLKKIQDNWLSNLVTIIQDQSVELHFKGSIKVKVHGIGYKIPVDYTEKIEL